MRFQNITLSKCERPGTWWSTASNTAFIIICYCPSHICWIHLALRTHPLAPFVFIVLPPFVQSYHRCFSLLPVYACTQCAGAKTVKSNLNPPGNGGVNAVLCCGFKCSSCYYSACYYINTHTHTLTANATIPATTQAFVLLLNLAPLQRVSCCGSHLKVFFKSLYFITWSFHVTSEPNRSLLPLTVRFTTFSSRSVPVAASTITPLAVLTLQQERGDLGPPLCLGAQQDVYGVDINMQTVVTHSLHSESWFDLFSSSSICSGRVEDEGAVPSEAWWRQRLMGKEECGEQHP